MDSIFNVTFTVDLMKLLYEAYTVLSLHRHHKPHATLYTKCCVTSGVHYFVQVAGSLARTLRTLTSITLLEIV